MSSSARTPSGNRAAILIMLVAVGVFSLMDAGLKLLVPHYPSMQIAALRGASSIPFVLVWIVPRLRAGALMRVRWGLHALRGVASIVMMASFVFALKSMSLATSYTVFFIGPPLVAALSVPLLGERVGTSRWIAIGVGLLGVLVVLRPTGDGLMTTAGLAMVVSAIAYALSSITVRVLARTDSMQAMVLWMLVSLTVGAGTLAWPDWVPVQPEHWPLVAGIGAAGALGQYTLTLAFSRGEAAAVAPFEYTALAWGVGLDAVLWGAVPDAATWIGATIIVGSGLALLKGEAREHASTHASGHAPADAP